MLYITSPMILRTALVGDIGEDVCIELIECIGCLHLLCIIGKCCSMSLPNLE